MEIIFATGNLHKLEEVQALMPKNIKLLTLKDVDFNKEIEETESTIEGNSLLKAKTVFNVLKKPVFAEDTGLEVKILNNEPGVYSARYAGNNGNATANMNLLLQNLKDKTDRTAQFKTVLTYINAQNQAFQFTGIVLGEITKEPNGGNGFGYDPIFKPAGFNKVFAEMDNAEKNLISHRAFALKKFLKFLDECEKK